MRIFADFILFICLNQLPVQLNPTLLSLLEHIGRGRKDGARQSDLSKWLNIDPRSLFFYIKTLQSAKLMYADDHFDLSAVSAKALP